jgi:hypothetical protein
MPSFLLWAGGGGAACIIHLPKGVVKGLVCRTGRWDLVGDESP